MKFNKTQYLIMVCLGLCLTSFMGCSKSDDTSADTTTPKTNATAPPAGMKQGATTTPQKPARDMTQ